MVRLIDAIADSTPRTRQKVVTFIAAGTIVAKEWVQLDADSTTDSVIKVEQAATSATGNPAVVGVALHGATTGQPVQVCVQGYVTGVAGHANVSAAFDRITVDATAGASDKHVKADHDADTVVGLSITAVASSASTVLVYNRMGW